MEKIYLYGNWKMNKGVGDTEDFIHGLKSEIEKRDGIRSMLTSDKLEIAIFPSFISLVKAKEAICSCNLQAMNVTMGSQNVFYKESGAYTGEISWAMLKDIECMYTLVGHSERRHIFGESDELISQKTRSALEKDLTVILCFGETLNERENGDTESVVERQIFSALQGIEKENPVLEKLILAYEPVWAIGTGKSAKPEDAEKVCSFAREKLSSLLGSERASKCPILYGGSVKPSNSELLLGQNNIDGVLVGGASLDPVTFLDIVEPFAK
jgi:triosephosphate isomerase